MLYLIGELYRRIGNIEGDIISGYVNIDADSLIRRTGTVTLAVTDRKISVGEDRYFWYNNKIELHIGVEYKKEIMWYKLGTFILDETSGLLNLNEKSITISLLDNMCLFDGTRGGKIDTKYKVEKHRMIHSVMEEIVENNNYPKKIIEDSDWEIPELIDKRAGDTYGSIISELRDAYIEYETFIDLHGNFVFRKVRNTKHDPIVYRFDEYDKNIVDISITYSFKNVKNKVQVFGRTNPDTGNTPNYTAENRHPNSPFSIDKIGVVFDSITNNKLYDIEQVITHSKGELRKASNLAETIGITCLPLYDLDVNQVVYIKIEKDDFNINGRFQIKKIRVPLDTDDLMNITLARLYDGEDGYAELGGKEERFMTIDDYIELDMKGIIEEDINYNIVRNDKQ